MLDAALLFPAISDLTIEGYQWISLSGGEPVLYPPLPALLQHAKGQGLRTAMVSNGMLLTPRQLDRIQPNLDLLVLSVDGKPAARLAGAWYPFRFYLHLDPAQLGRASLGGRVRRQ